MANLRVATFNCEWRRTASRDAGLIRERVFGGGVDVVCLTETHSDFLQGDGHVIESAPFEQGPNAVSRRKVLLWSRSPWRDVDAAGPDGIPKARFVAGTTDTPAGQVRVIGVVIPYSFAGVRYGEPRHRPWELHLRYLQALAASLPPEPALTILLGDFNQRIPRKYQPQRIFDELERVLLRRFALATGGVLEPIGRQAIDHVCHSPDLTCRNIATISNLRPDGGKISDHFGVRVELMSAST